MVATFFSMPSRRFAGGPYVKKPRESASGSGLPLWRCSCCSPLGMILFTLAAVLWPRERDKDATLGKKRYCVVDVPFASTAKVCTSGSTRIRLGALVPSLRDYPVGDIRLKKRAS